MKILAHKGDTYSFTGTPTITHIAVCPTCQTKTKPWMVGLREFTSSAICLAWVSDHEDLWPGHKVAVSTEVIAR